MDDQMAQHRYTETMATQRTLMGMSDDAQTIAPGPDDGVDRPSPPSA